MMKMKLIYLAVVGFSVVDEVLGFMITNGETPSHFFRLRQLVREW